MYPASWAVPKIAAGSLVVESQGRRPSLQQRDQPVVHQRTDNPTRINLPGTNHPDRSLPHQHSLRPTPPAAKAVHYITSPPPISHRTARPRKKVLVSRNGPEKKPGEHGGRHAPRRRAVSQSVSQVASPPRSPSPAESHRETAPNTARAPATPSLQGPVSCRTELAHTPTG